MLYQVSNVVGSAYAPTDESNEEKVQQNDDKEKVNEEERSNTGKISNFNKIIRSSAESWLSMAKNATRAVVQRANDLTTTVKEAVD